MTVVDMYGGREKVMWRKEREEGRKGDGGWGRGGMRGGKGRRREGSRRKGELWRKKGRKEVEDTNLTEKIEKQKRVKRKKVK